MSGVLDMLKDVWDLVEKSKDAALKQAFIDLRLRVIELQEENITVREEKLSLQEQLQRQQREFEWDGQFYWDRIAPGPTPKAPTLHRSPIAGKSSVCVQAKKIQPGFRTRGSPSGSSN